MIRLLRAMCHKRLACVYPSVVVIFIVGIILPLIQMKYPMVKEGQLNGVILSAQRVPLDFHSWFNRSFQDSFDAWFNEHVGFRTYLVKTDNQINFNIFHDVSTKSNARIIVGKENYLYEYGYVSEYVRRYGSDIQELEQIVARMQKLQDILEKKNIPFVFVISPSKASVYPEYIPSSYIFENKKNELRDYDKFLPLLRAYGIHYIDGHTIAQEIKNSHNFGSFTKGGTHWNYYTACVVSSHITSEIERQSLISMKHVLCDPLTIDTQMNGTDKDILELLNLWNKNAFMHEVPHPQLKVEQPAHVQDMNILFVGDSFVWTLTNIMDNRVYRDRDVLYYFATKYPLSGSSTPIVADTFDWKKVLEVDAVIIETNEVALGKAGFGFIEEAIAHLE